MSESDPRAYEELLGSPAPQGFDYLVSPEDWARIQSLREGKTREQADLAVMFFYGIPPNSRFRILDSPLRVEAGDGYLLYISPYR